MRKEKHREGFVLTAALMLLLIGSLVVGSLLSVSRQTHPSVVRWREYDNCLMAAQTAMEKIKANLYDDFRIEHEYSRSWNDLNWVVANAAGFATNGLLSSILEPGALTDVDYGDAVITATVGSSDVKTGTTVDERYVVVTNTVEVTRRGVTRKIEETVFYSLNRSSVFDHAYFINNFGWFYGVDCVVNGDIRSNFDVELRSRDLILNGNSYAYGVNDIRRPYQSWNWTTYKNNGNSDFFRPTYHVDQHRNNAASVFEWGYDDADTYDYQSKLDMPYIGNLSDYKYYAEEHGGTVEIAGTVEIDNVFSFDDPGPSDIAGAADKGCKYLRGTEDDPIEINGPVVVEGDLIIEGYYTGQGTIYAGRNIYIIGDLVAQDPAQWEHPDTASNFETNTLPNNLGNDFMGLAAKGAVILGDHRDISSSSRDYLKPPFTAEYAVSATDADIGYVSYVSDGVCYFDGDYTAHSGWRYDESDSSGQISRNFFEPSVSLEKFDDYNPSSQIGRIDAFIYNNHLTTGRFSSGAMINGGIICRDEALFPSGRIYMNWDPRVAMDHDFTPFLPLEVAPGETIRWREITL